MDDLERTQPHEPSQWAAYTPRRKRRRYALIFVASAAFPVLAVLIFLAAWTIDWSFVKAWSEEEVVLSPAPPSREIIEHTLQLPVPTPRPQMQAVAIQNSPFTITANRGRSTTIAYYVQNGETLFDIAARFQINNCSLLWANDVKTLSPFRPHTEVKIPPTDGLVITVAEPVTIRKLAQENNTSPQTLIYSPYNHHLLNASPDDRLHPGTQVMIPGGIRDDCTPWIPPPWLANNDDHPRLIGCDYDLNSRSRPSNPPMIDGYSFVQGFTEQHSGIDLAAPRGTPVFAVADGMVRFAGWHSGGFGNVIVIDHGGRHSLYGHLETIHVNCGQPVRAKQYIGGVGTTGNSTDNHLHFELRTAGFAPYNPLYILYSGF